VTATIRLEACELRKLRFGERREVQTVLEGVSLAARAGEILLLLGPSGGGKSTLLRLLNRLEDPDQGRILLDGTDITQIDPLLVRRRVALMVQKPFLFPVTVRENLQMACRFRQTEPPDETADEWRQVMDQSRLELSLLDRDARRLSVGQQQRVCLARALMGGSDVLLLDEPTSALDPPTVEALAATFRRLAKQRGLTLLLATHDLGLARSLADRVLFLAGGRILEDGPAETLLTAPRTPELKAFLASEECRA